jgi:hypothetical protein
LQYVKEAVMDRPRNMIGVIFSESNNDAVVGRHTQEDRVMDANAVV